MFPTNLPFYHHYQGYTMSILRKYVLDPTHVLDYKPFQLEEYLTYEERPI